MKKLLLVLIIGGVFCGCTSNPPPQILPAATSHISVVAPNRDALKQAIITAATRRRWVPSVISENVIRCTLIQRQYKVEIEVVMENDNSYSIRCVSCNIPENKYQQWVGNLQREIAKNAAR